ncbi:hypothetical protein [Ideonella sp. A 288]|uniref:hypothetical protein n=1 Tax=Ideonella sp. A 288 TaxID=1962181 RepID=UPI000B4A8181|nr:hypothetical protein [Ideonella sp. A 288]
MTSPRDAHLPRGAALSGLALTAAIAVWWLGSTRLALGTGADASRAAADALQALWLVRAMGLGLVGLRTGSLHGWGPGAAAAAAWVAPAWPLVLLAGSASSLPWARLALAEGLLLAAGAALPLVGQGLRRTVRRAGLAESVATLTSVALLAAVWLARGWWAAPPP